MSHVRNYAAEQGIAEEEGMKKGMKKGMASTLQKILWSRRADRYGAFSRRYTSSPQPKLG